MRRIVLALMGALVGTTLLVGFKAHGAPGQTDVSVDGPLDPQAAGGPGTDPGAAVPGATGPGGGAAPTNGASPGPGQSPGATGQPTTRPPTAAPTTTAPTTTKTVTGKAVAVITAQSPTSKSSPCGDCHDYTMSVTIKVSGSKITSATVTYNTSPGASLSYATTAQSTLSKILLAAGTQTWRMGKVSGATYSGNAWELSLQDAMAKAGLPV